MKEFRQEPERAKPKIGQEHASAMLRAGGKELSAIMPAFPDSVQPVEEYGLFGTKLPSEIADAKQGPVMDPNLNLDLEM